MNGKKILSLFMLLSLALSAYRPPAPPRPDSTPKMVIQLLTVVHENGSADFSYILKISQALVQTLRSLPNFSEGTLCSDAFKQFENSVITFTQENHGEDIWCTYTKHLDDLQALETQWKDDFEHLTVRRLEIKSGTFYFDISWTAFPCATTDTSVLTCEWSVQMPGKVGDNNATKAEGATLTWDMSSPGTPYHFTAQSAVGNSVLGMDPTLAVIGVVVLLGCCCVLLLAAGGVGFFLIRRKSDSGEPPAAVDPGAPNP